MPSAAVHLSWFTAQLYDEQISIGVIAVTQACCEPVLQSNTEQWGMHFALPSAAVHLSWFTAHLYLTALACDGWRLNSLQAEAAECCFSRALHKSFAHSLYNNSSCYLL